MEATFRFGDKVKIRGSQMEGVVQCTIVKRPHPLANKVVYVLIDHSDGRQIEYTIDEVKKIEN